MIYKSTLLHLRIPFSFFLMPVFLFALAISPNLGESRLKWAFIIIHLLLYPASNGFNSYFDKDEKSIGGLKNPPPVSKALYWTSLLMDAIAIVLGFLYVSYWFSIMLLIYGLVSKAYSHPSIRLKKYPILGWMVTGIFQGFFTFCMCYIGINNYEPENLLHLRIIFPAALTTLMLWANYPMTQVYQHEEDKAHGDFTLSRRLGIRGTFIFAAVFFGVTTVGFLLYFGQFQQMKYGITFLEALSPVVVYFGYWFLRVWQNPARADYEHAMRLNFISALCLNIFFVWLFLSISHIGEYLF